MIITSREKLDVGKVYGNESGLIFEILGEAQPRWKFLVLRESDREEYERSIIEEYGPRDDYNFNEFYYEISTD